MYGVVNSILKSSLDAIVHLIHEYRFGSATIRAVAHTSVSTHVYIHTENALSHMHTHTLSSSSPSSSSRVSLIYLLSLSAEELMIRKSVAVLRDAGVGLTLGAPAVAAQMPLASSGLTRMDRVVSLMV